jgi:hypothetical protein
MVVQFVVPLWQVLQVEVVGDAAPIMMVGIWLVTNVVVSAPPAVPSAV